MIIESQRSQPSNPLGAATTEPKTRQLRHQPTHQYGVGGREEGEKGEKGEWGGWVTSCLLAQSGQP